MLIKVTPFAVVAIFAELSLALPPGPTSYTDTWISVLLLALSAASLALSTNRLPQWADVLSPLLYVASTLALILAAGGSSAGVGLVVLLPVIWAALNLDAWKSALVVLAVVIIELVTTYTPVDVTDTVRIRREFAFAMMGALIVFAIHEIRASYSRIIAQRELRENEMSQSIGQVFEQNRVTSVISNLVEMLNFCDVEVEAYEVFDFAARQLFVQGGFIGILTAARDDVAVTCNWYGEESIDPFPVERCHSIATALPYESGPDAPSCTHFHRDSTGHTLCYPLIIQREVMGLLTIAIPDDELARSQFQDSEHYHQYARLLGNQFSIWLVNFKLRESLRNLSIRDPLTNLFNRRFMIETLHREMTMAVRTDEPTSVVQIDIDHFKTYNDRYGHDVGDVVLCSVAEIMLGLFRESDVPCRSGGEEFTMILPRCEWEIANLRATELQARLKVMTIQVARSEDRPVPPTLSIGIATSPEHGLTGEELLRSADAALYSAKAAGRNRIVRATAVASGAPGT
jgi:diguanylate cyclase (GGDEF)-like protein